MSSSRVRRFERAAALKTRSVHCLLQPSQQSPCQLYFVPAYLVLTAGTCCLRIKQAARSAWFSEDLSSVLVDLERQDGRKNSCVYVEKGTSCLEKHLFLLSCRVDSFDSAAGLSSVTMWLQSGPRKLVFVVTVTVSEKRLLSAKMLWSLVLQRHNFTPT